MALSDKLIKKYILESNMIVPAHLTSTNEMPETKQATSSFGLDACGYDVRLGPIIKRPKNNLVDNVSIGQSITLLPGECILAETMGVFNMPRNVTGKCMTKSSYARQFIYVITTKLQPGWSGKLVLEIKNISELPVKLVIGAGIAHIEFDLIHGEVETSYSEKSISRFNNQRGINKLDGITVHGDPNQD